VSKSRVSITAGAVLLSAALAVSLFSSQQSKNITPKQVLTWDCETAEHKPESITITCGDIHASEAILGQSGAEDKTNPLRPGEALIWINGRLERTTLFEVPELSGNLWTSVTTQKMTLEEVQNQEKIICAKYGI
jgi:hypothetical protein